MNEQQSGMVVRPPQGGAVQVARQGFGEQSIERQNSAAVAMAERARAEVQARYVVAIQRPRNVEEFRTRLLDHCKRPRFAESARYSKPIGGQAIEGVSIRFVETALAEYGNVLPESSVLFEDDDQIVLRVTVTDLERNITHAAEATIRKRVERKYLRKDQKAIGQRVNSKGDIVYIVEATDDDVANAKAARESKLIRNLGLRILPRDVVDEAEDQCKATLEDQAAKDPAGERRKIIDGFHAIGVSPGDLVAYLGHPLERLQPAEMAELRAFYAAVRDGDTTWSDVLETKNPRGDASPSPQATPPARGTAAVKAQLQRQPAAAPMGESQAPVGTDSGRSVAPRVGKDASVPDSVGAPPGVPRGPEPRQRRETRNGPGPASPPGQPTGQQTLTPAPRSEDDAIADELAMTIDALTDNPSWLDGVADRLAGLRDDHPRKAELLDRYSRVAADIAAEQAAADEAAQGGEG